MKKLLAMLLALVMVLAFVGCKKTEPVASNTEETETSEAAGDLKIGVVLVGDENEGYTWAHIEGVKAAQKALGLSDDQIMWKYSVGEDETCYDACAEMVDSGCKAVFTNSYGHQTYTQQAATDFPEVQFVALTGDNAIPSGLDNLSNAFTCVYESRYVSGVVAGMKLAELVENDALKPENFDADGNIKIGYVGAYPYAEVVSGYTAFFLGIRSIVENVAMEVQYTNSWFDITAEAEAANFLVSDGCVIIGQHADSTGAPSAVQALLDGGTVCYSVGYNVDMLSVAPTAALTSATNNWGVYYTYAFKTLLDGGKIATNWAEGYSEDAVAITELGESCAEGTAEKVEEIINAIKAGTFHVFDTNTFTVGGEHLDSYLIDMNGDFVNDDEEAIMDGYFHESELRSAPSFDIRIDGITELN